MKLWDIYRGKDYHIEPTLERIREAVRYVGDPQKNFPSLLVGGTNGKGSTCAFLESILRAHGLKTGWFVSPHLVEEEERWRINGEPMGEEELRVYVKELKGVFEKFGLTYFEAATLIALLYFRDKEVDVAVMEVGMGGRWDATKVCEPEVIGITNVERDHTRWLGETVEDIAVEKLCLYREGTPLVLGSSRYPLYAIALEMGLRGIVSAGEDYTYSGAYLNGKTVLREFRFEDLEIGEAELGLWGKWQVDNAAMSVTMAKIFMDVQEEKILKALRETRWEGRMEILRESPFLIVDGSHNPYSVGKVVKELIKGFENMNILFTGLKEKEWKLSMEIIRRYTDSILLAEINHPRGESLKNLYTYAKNLGFKDIKILNSPAEVWELDEDVCAIGSLYLVGEIKEAVKKIVI